jgi:hypothetical protein
VAAAAAAGGGGSGRQGVVIVGGGPAGLSAALMLSQRGWTDITVVERNESVTFTDPQRWAGGGWVFWWALLISWLGCRRVRAQRGGAGKGEPPVHQAHELTRTLPAPHHRCLYVAAPRAPAPAAHPLARRSFVYALDGRSSRLLQQLGLLRQLQERALDGRWASYVLVSPGGEAKVVADSAESEEQEVGG